jgi:GTP-dependent phosphoenolpyruvate carboxykinase
MKINDHIKKINNAIKKPIGVVGIGHAQTIKELEEKNYKLQKQVEFLQLACREAATKIKKLEEQVESFTNPLTKMRKGGM